MDKFIDIFTHRSFLLTIFLTLIYFGIGFAFLHFGLADYGSVFFVLLPTSLGIAIGKMENQKWVHLGFAISLLIFIVLLIAGGLEGFVCVFMALPIIIPMVWIGVLINKLLTKKGIIKPRNDLKVMIFPLFIVLFGAPLEKYFTTGEIEIIEIKTERIYPYTPDQVYNTIKSVDTLINILYEFYNRKHLKNNNKLDNYKWSNVCLKYLNIFNNYEK